MISKKIIVILAAFLMLVAVSTTIVFAATDFDFSRISAIRNDVNKDETVVIINGEEVTIEQVDLKGHELLLSNNSDIPIEALDAISYETVIIPEVREQGAKPSLMETLAYIRELKAIYDEGGSIDLNSDYLNDILDHIDALGLSDYVSSYIDELNVSEKEYWENEAIIDGYRDELATAKARARFAEEFGYTQDDLLVPQHVEVFEATFEEQINQKLQKTDIIFPGDFEADSIAIPDSWE